jgi:hypothetical protein
MEKCWKASIKRYDRRDARGVSQVQALSPQPSALKI